MPFVGTGFRRIGPLLTLTGRKSSLSEHNRKILAYNPVVRNIDSKNVKPIQPIPVCITLSNPIF